MRLADDTDLMRLAGQLETIAAFIRKPANCQCKVTRHNDDGQLEELPACRSQGEHARRVARQAEGWLRSAGGGRGSDHADPTAAAFLTIAQRDHRGPEWWLHNLARDVKLLSAAGTDLVMWVAELGKVTKTDPKELANNGQGDCGACGASCSGAHNDRLVSGYCDTCYRNWRRKGSPDRFVFQRERRAEIAARSEGAA